MAKAKVSHAFQVRYLRRSRQLYRQLIEGKPWIRQLYKSFLGLRPGLRIVDVGCGTGDFTRYLAELIEGRCRILGVDMRAPSLKAAEAETTKAGFGDRISYRKGEAYKIPVEDGFSDLTCCRTVLMHLQDPVKAVREMARVTKKGGMVAAVERGRMQSFWDPKDQAFAKMSEKMNKCWVDGFRKLDGVDYAIGDELPRIFMNAGLSKIKAELSTDTWLNCDSRRKLADIKAELRFDLQVAEERKAVDRKALLAGGATGQGVDRYFRLYNERARRLLSDDGKLRRDGSFYAASWYLVAGQKT